jgi:DNA topoisomerase-6 subunit A
LGITADDIENYGLKKHLIAFKDVDLKRIEQLQNYEWFKDNKQWQRQFKLMKTMKAKAEIQALSSRGISFITDKYLPEKIKKQDWID